jgi:NADPH:quinone reductase-like Zn-dependent oxidoreductase
MITGASGAVGASTVQIAHSIGARITGVCGTANVDYVRSIGADFVIDYKTDSWHHRDEQFDVIFDAAAAASFTGARPRLATIGVYINTMPGPALYWASLLAKLGSRQRCVPFMLKTDAALLQRLAKLAADGVIVPHVHEIIDLSQVASAQRRMQGGQIHGKVCVRENA